MYKKPFSEFEQHMVDHLQDFCYDFSRDISDDEFSLLKSDIRYFNEIADLCTRILLALLRQYHNWESRP